MEKIIKIPNIGDCMCPECRGMIYHTLKKNYELYPTNTIVYYGYLDQKHIFNKDGYKRICLNKEVGSKKH
ncbi:hypothetical protein CPAV1605_62 [seawater metagenome]|uniref:Uncharacterized protein n=1 Tax=seawater metagenome TaxID=1561972 RepID=A0A5E8CLP9_9ZZZZ